MPKWTEHETPQKTTQSEGVAVVAVMVAALLVGCPALWLWLSWIEGGASAWNDGWARYWGSVAIIVPAILLVLVVIRARIMSGKG